MADKRPPTGKEAMIDGDGAVKPDVPNVIVCGDQDCTVAAVAYLRSCDVVEYTGRQEAYTMRVPRYTSITLRAGTGPTIAFIMCDLHSPKIRMYSVRRCMVWRCPVLSEHYDGFCKAHSPGRTKYCFVTTCEDLKEDTFALYCKHHEHLSGETVQ